jgi:hypothetical protein
VPKSTLPSPKKCGFAEALLRKLILDPDATTPIRVDPTGP